jgi:DHA2 family lincomycin resistance protein-like MFS transporter
MSTGPISQAEFGQVAQQPAGGAARPLPGAGGVIGLLVFSAFVMILNETIMSVALPVLIVDLDIAARTAQWLTSGFLLTMAVVIPMIGSLLQRFPVRSIFVAAMSMFCAGTLISALAPGFRYCWAGASCRPAAPRSWCRC